MNKKVILFLAIAVVAVLLFIVLGVNNEKRDSVATDGSEDTGTHDITLLHVSFDIAREIGKQLTEGFIPWYKEKSGIEVAIEQSNGGSSRQARAVSDGLPADVVSMNQYLDIDLLYERSKDTPEGALIPEDWQSKYPNNSSPASSTMAFVVRKGNPKNIQDWDDLIREGVEVIAPNYRSTGNGRYSLLTAYAYGLHKYQGGTKSDAVAKDFVRELIGNTVVLASGGRAATNVFVERGQGDVLLTFEAEVNLIVRDLAPDDFEVIVPSYGVDAKIYVVVVEENAKKKGQKQYDAAKAFWDFIYTDEGQEIVAKTFFRPINTSVASQYTHVLPNIELFDIDTVFGGWKSVQEKLFSDEGVVASIYEETGRN